MKLRISATVDRYPSCCHNYNVCYCSKRHSCLLILSTSFGFYLRLLFVIFLSANALNDRLYKRFSELSRLATNSECVDQLMDLMRMQNSMDEILNLISQATSPQVHARIAELLHTLLNVSYTFSFFVFFSLMGTNSNHLFVMM